MRLAVLESCNCKELEALISETERTISDETFWLPISEISREHFFDKEWTHFVGIYEDECLVAAGALFFHENEYGENIRLLSLPNVGVAELGRLMVLPKYRGRGYIGKIIKTLLEDAKKQGIRYIVATAHPKNVASQKALGAIGLQKRAYCVKKEKYERDIFLLEL